MAKGLHPAAVTPASDRWMDTNELSVYLLDHYNIRRRPRTLQQMRRDGDGPKFHRFGNDVRYRPKAADEWVVENFGDEVSSTSEEAARRLLVAAKGA